MRRARPIAAILRAEARVLSVAGLFLLAIGFPVTLFLVALALAPQGISPALPAAIGAPPILLGYLACYVASRRWVMAKESEFSGRVAAQR
jgi:hypothetical protein